MKNKKWLAYTLVTLLTLVILVVVAGAGFRIGLMQNESFKTQSFPRNFDNSARPIPGNFPGFGGPQAMDRNSLQDFDRFQDKQSRTDFPGFNKSGYDRHARGLNLLSIIFGLIHLAVLGLLIWLGYKLFQKSGWRLTHAAASPAPTSSETPGAEIDEKKGEV